MPQSDPSSEADGGYSVGASKQMRESDRRTRELQRTKQKRQQQTKERGSS